MIRSSGILWLALLVVFACPLGCGKQSYKPGPWNQRASKSVEAHALVVKMRSAIHKDPTLARQLLYIGVDEKNGSLVLTGVLPSQEQVDSLKNLAAQIAGNGRVIDQLKVAKPLK